MQVKAKATVCKLIFSQVKYQVGLSGLSDEEERCVKREKSES